MSSLPESIAELISPLAPLGPDRDPGALSESEVRSKTSEALKAEGISGTGASLVMSAALLMHDHLDSSHSISQDISSASGSMLHAVMHRREPDYGNARYWWNRTGNHPCFDQLAQSVTDLLSDEGADVLQNQLLTNGSWDAYAMNDLVANAERGRSDETTRDLLKKVQRLEIQSLLEYELA